MWGEQARRDRERLGSLEARLDIAEETLRTYRSDLSELQRRLTGGKVPPEGSWAAEGRSGVAEAVASEAQRWASTLQRLPLGDGPMPEMHSEEEWARIRDLRNENIKDLASRMPDPPLAHDAEAEQAQYAAAQDTVADVEEALEETYTEELRRRGQETTPAGATIAGLPVPPGAITSVTEVGALRAFVAQRLAAATHTAAYAEARLAAHSLCLVGSVKTACDTTLARHITMCLALRGMLETMDRVQLLTLASLWSDHRDYHKEWTR